MQVSLIYQWQKILLVTDIGLVVEIRSIVGYLHFVKFNQMHTCHYFIKRILYCIVLYCIGVGECFFWYRLTRVVPDRGP